MRHRAITPEQVARAGQLAAGGLPLVTVASALGVERTTLWRWCRDPAAAGPCNVCNVIRGGQAAALETLVGRIYAGTAADARWLLTHAPAWRETWSDAAHSRRLIRQTLADVVQVIRRSDLTLEQQELLLLAMAAAGIGAGGHHGDGRD